LLVANLAPQRIATAAIKTAGTAAGLIEQAGSQGRIGRQKRFRLREDLPGNSFGGRIQRTAQKFRPINAAGVADFVRLDPTPELAMCRRAGDDGLNEKIGIAMNHVRSSHASPAGFAYGCLPSLCA